MAKHRCPPFGSQSMMLSWPRRTALAVTSNHAAKYLFLTQMRHWHAHGGPQNRQILLASTMYLNVQASVSLCIRTHILLLHRRSRNEVLAGLRLRTCTWVVSGEASALGLRLLRPRNLPNRSGRQKAATLRLKGAPCRTNMGHGSVHWWLHEHSSAWGHRRVCK